jgi:tetratricopeptide (TPR) repeat protein
LIDQALAVQRASEAESSLRNGNRGQAVRLFQEALLADPKNHHALRALALMLASAGQIEEGIQLAERALVVAPSDWEIAAFLGSAYMRQGDTARAITSLSRAIEVNPAIADLQQTVGLLLLHQSQLESAEPHFRAAIALDPAHSALSYAGLAQILAARQNPKEAAAMLRRAYELEPNSPVGKFNLGQALFHENKLPEAELAYRDAIELSRDFEPAYDLLGQLLQQRGRFAEAEALLRRGQELNPLRGSNYLSIVTGRKVTEEDRPLLEKMRGVLADPRLAPGDRCSVHYALAKALNDVGDYQSAMLEYDRANALAKDTLLQRRPFRRESLIQLYRHAEDTFTREFFKKNRGLGSESRKPIFIVGMMRSGTTLTEQIVSSHPLVAAGGELTFWNQEAKGLLREDGKTVDRQRLQEVQRSYLTLLEDIGQGKSHVTDKMPANYFALGLIYLAFPNAKVLHCKRDPVDTVLSIYMTPNSVPVDFAHDRDNIVFAYREYQRLTDYYHSVLPPEFLMAVHYEDLVANREATTRKIIEFLGVEWDDACLNYEENERLVSTPTLWQARQPIYKTAVHRWKRYEPWLGVFKSLCDESSD